MHLIQTLHDWCMKSGHRVKMYPNGNIYVDIDQSDPHRAGLWQLTDFLVSTANGSIVWLHPRKGA